MTEPESTKGLTQQVELFRRHSRRLSQVAAYAAQSSADSESESVYLRIIGASVNKTKECTGDQRCTLFGVLLCSYIYKWPS